MIQLENVSKVYGSDASIVNALNSIDLSVDEGEFVVVMGKSGCGKSTLLRILGGITTPSAGIYKYNQEIVDFSSQSKLARFRNRNIGVILQSFALIPDISVFQNIALALKYKEKKESEPRKRILEVAEALGIMNKLKSYPNQLSGGQQQRVAIARAIINSPKLILADEPTGALDKSTGKEIIRILSELNADGVTVILVTHDEELASCGSSIYHMSDGSIIDTVVHNYDPS